jgi:prenyltransferase beta subunit
MLQVARLAPKLLGDSAELVHQFLIGQRNDDGGFRDRAGRSDLYYTVFGLEGLMALQIHPSLKSTDHYLTQFGHGDQLDFVHLCCLARCRATLTQMGLPAASRQWATAVSLELARFRARDGGFYPAPAAASSSVYADFLAVAAYQDLRVPLPEPERLLAALLALRVEDGSWANERPVRLGATNATAAAVTLLRNLSAPVDPAVGDWLRSRFHPQGGFVAVPNAPIPDLLSTATALHALSGLQRSFGDMREACLDFIDTLWTNEGAFHGHWDDHHLDVEYAYYGLLALGHLSL